MQVAFTARQVTPRPAVAQNAPAKREPTAADALSADAADGTLLPMKLLDFLQGKWLGHPLHPAIVHVPLGLWPLATVADLVGFFGFGGVALTRLAFYGVLIALLAALLAVPPGAADWATIKKEKPAWRIGLYHLLLNLVGTLIWAINFGLRLDSFDQAPLVTLPVLITSILGTLLVMIGGYLGSLLVFEHGTSVARQSKAKWRALAAESGSKLPDSQ